LSRLTSRTPLLLLFLSVLPMGVLFINGSAGQEVTDPYLGQPEAIKSGRAIYGAKCYVCHHSAGARGPNLFATKLTDEQFLQTVTNGRKNTQMPAFGSRLSPAEIWQLHAFIKSTDHY
jgi:mono/diheme cytochrome c family protein